MSFTYFDLHIHPVFKTLFRGRKSQLSAWENIEISDAVLGNCFESQSSLKQLFEKRNVNLICVGDHAPEMGTVDQWILRAVAISIYRKFLGITRINRLAKGKVDYQMVHEDEIRNLTKKAPKNSKEKGERKIKILTKMSDYDPKDFNTIYILFHVEGSHMFYEKRNGDDDLKTMLKNVDHYLEDRLLLYATITHLTPNVFCNHAYGNKFLAKGKLMPYKKGLRDFGKELVKKLYSKNVLVDLKHMSWVARQDLYKLRKEQGWDEKPLIASHIGLTGFKVSDRFTYIRSKGIKRGEDIMKVRYNEVPGIIKDTHFNPNSINFYDDDIVEILKSKGLIGISLDNRILGAADPTEMEFVSNDEMVIWLSQTTRAPEDIFDPQHYIYSLKRGENTIEFDEEDIQASKEEFEEMFPQKRKGIKAERPDLSELHLKHFINHLLKIKQVYDVHRGELQDINPWDHICIGSDFDGLISTLHCCRNVTEVERVCKNDQKKSAGLC